MAESTLGGTRGLWAHSVCEREGALCWRAIDSIGGFVVSTPLLKCAENVRPAFTRRGNLVLVCVRSTMSVVVIAGSASVRSSGDRNICWTYV